MRRRSEGQTNNGRCLERENKTEKKTSRREGGRCLQIKRGEERGSDKSKNEGR